ncbi:MAG TPA: helix-turn-helix transcriptional regulator [Candidatus Saccharimonadales bacterium]|jgi:transcriptional regulator with XRE-family HTH domain|nr:helix-turn-helix transcriptional regulator [Candidatus Saccharimonadales bacterium]
MAKGDGNQSLGDYIRSRRLSLGLSRAGAAEAADLDASYWAKLENGNYIKPAPPHLSAISDVLEVPVADLYALAGYEIPAGLPSFQPYLRARYDLPAEAVSDLERYFEYLRSYYGIPKDQPVYPPRPEPEQQDDSPNEEAA